MHQRAAVKHICAWSKQEEEEQTAAKNLAHDHVKCATF